MDSLKEYNIDFVKLKLGQHAFNFKIDNSFFKLKENSLVEQGDVDVHLLIDKKERLMNFTFTFEGIVETECNRCLDSIKIPVSGKESIVIKITEEPKESDGEIFYIGPHEISFNVYDQIYEFICTSIPMSTTCLDNADGEKQCNPDMLKFLSESDEEETDLETPTDPRWDKLKNIKE